jgi:hypothetical protein
VPSTAVASGPAGSGSSKLVSQGTPKRVLKLSVKRRATLKLQGQYMGHLRSLPAPQKAAVKKANARGGFAAAIKLAKKLRMWSAQRDAGWGAETGNRSLRLVIHCSKC